MERCGTKRGIMLHPHEVYRNVPKERIEQFQWRPMIPKPSGTKTMGKTLPI
jgi:hypothetical protein